MQQHILLNYCCITPLFHNPHCIHLNKPVPLYTITLDVIIAVRYYTNNDKKFC